MFRIEKKAKKFGGLAWLNFSASHIVIAEWRQIYFAFDHLIIQKCCLGLYKLQCALKTIAVYSLFFRSLTTQPT